MSEFDDKVVLVTGGASGIGKASAQAFARQGAIVVIAGRRQIEGEATAAELTSLGARARFVAMDVTQPDQLAELHDLIERDYGRLDVAFNNAGYQEPRAPSADQD